MDSFFLDVKRSSGRKKFQVAGASLREGMLLDNNDNIIYSRQNKLIELENIARE